MGHKLSRSLDSCHGYMHGQSHSFGNVKRNAQQKNVASELEELPSLPYQRTVELLFEIGFGQTLSMIEVVA